MSRRQNDHIGNRKFKIEFSGLTSTSFSECSGLEVEIEVVVLKDGDGILQQKNPGTVNYSNILLKRGYTANDELWIWIKNVLDGQFERRSGSVILLGDDSSEISRYNFFEAWPCRWKGFVLDSMSTGVTIEELELAVEKIELA